MKERFHLYSDTRKFAIGSSLYLIQNGKPKLTAYVNKRLPEAAQNYSITELEMCALAINIASSAHLLKKVDVDAIVGHLALMHIMKSKMEPVTTRIKSLLGILSSYSFNLYYIKEKDMILSNFLLKQEHDNSNLYKAIPISFNMSGILHERHYTTGKVTKEDRYLVQNRLQSKSSGVSLPEVHGVQKGIDTHVKLGKQAIKPTTVSTEVKITVCRKPRIGQGRAGLRRKVKMVPPSQPNKPAQVVPLSEKQQKTKIREQPQATVDMESQTKLIPIIHFAPKQFLSPRTLTKQVPPYSDLYRRPPPRLPDLKES